MKPSSVLILGASGYVGSTLAARMMADGATPRVGGRNVDGLRERYPDLDVVRVDVLEPDTLPDAFANIDTVYHLVHSMADADPGFAERDRTAARNVAQAAEAAGVRRIVYLGGLGDPDDELSHHLASRQETGRVLASGSVQVLELRAGIIIGPGSASYRMISDLVKRLPVMVTPRWVTTRAQPIGIDDVISYLVAGADVETSDHHQVIEIGGADVDSYRSLMQRFAVARGQRPPVIVSVPVLTPRLSSAWCGFVTSVPASIARPLIDGLRNEVIVRESIAKELFPEIQPIGFDEAVRRALAAEGESR